MASHQSLFAPNLTHISQYEFQIMCTWFWRESEWTSRSLLLRFFSNSRFVSFRANVFHIWILSFEVEFECHRLSTHTHRARESHPVARFNLFSLQLHNCCCTAWRRLINFFFRLLPARFTHTTVIDRFYFNFTVMFMYITRIDRSLTLASLTNKPTHRDHAAAQTHFVFILFRYLVRFCSVSSFCWNFRFNSLHLQHHFMCP